MASVLVTDGEQRSALAVVRSLGRAGHQVHVASSRKHSLAGTSRYCHHSVQTPDPLSQPASFVDYVRGYVKQAGIEVMLPISDASALALLPIKDSLGTTVIPFPSHDAFVRICDKHAVMQAASEVGIRIPEQRVINSVSEATTTDFDGLGFPLVLKPARSVVSLNGKRSKTAVLHVSDAQALRHALTSLPAEAFPVLVQRRVVGPGVGVFLLLWNGEVFAAFSHRRIREKPPSGGVSVLRESVALDPKLLERSSALLKSFGWQGAAMVEYKIDSATGDPYLMEINGRFWGSLQLAIDAGVDFPQLLVSLALGQRPAPVRSYRIGVQTRWLMGDVDQLLTRLRRSRAQLSLPPDVGGKGKAVLEFLAAFGPSSRGEVFRVSDPMPGILETLNWIRGR